MEGQRARVTTVLLQALKASLLSCSLCQHLMVLVCLCVACLGLTAATSMVLAEARRHHQDCAATGTPSNHNHF